MQTKLFSNLLLKLVIVLFLFSLQKIDLNAQVRTRNNSDSIQAQANGVWYSPVKYQFQEQFPRLQVIPPLSTGMPYNIMTAYILLDSLMRMNINQFPDPNIVSRWKSQKTENDTIVAGIKYLYEMIDYDPIRFFQYMHSQSSSFYNINLISLRTLSNNLVNTIPGSNAMSIMSRADYILRVKINSIDFMPYPSHPDRGLFNVHATVTDTLKGQVYQNCNVQNIINNKQTNKTMNNNSQICFTYIYGPYTNENSNYIVDSSILDSTGNMSLQPGMDLVISLSFLNLDYLWDYNYDYFKPSLIEALPIINGQVKDDNKEWSNSQLLNYSDWKNAFLQTRTILFNGGN